MRKDEYDKKNIPKKEMLANLFIYIQFVHLIHDFLLCSAKT